jgi:uncharacterized protein YjiS (DUF1127 family)
MDGLLTKQELSLLISPQATPLGRELAFLEMAAAERHAARRRGFAGWVRTLPERVHAWVERRIAAAELNSLSDRELSDIGLSRGDIGRVSRL